MQTRLEAFRSLSRRALMALPFALLSLKFQATPAYGAPNRVGAGKAPQYRLNHRSVERARRAVSALDKSWLISSPASTTWKGINAWQRFVIADSLTKYTRLTGDRSRLSEIERAVDNHEGLDGNDDDLWAVIASINIYSLAPSPHFLQSAESNFKRITDNYWDNTCGGGIWWDHERTYKNAITNELLLYASTSLYRTTKDRSYLAWAMREWKWFNSSGMINEHGLINDGLDKNCANNGQNTYTYNQGVILGGLVDLYLIDGDYGHILLASRLATASISTLSTPDGIFREPVAELNQDGQAFKGIFVHHLGHLVPLIKDQHERQAITEFIVRNADAVWTHRRLSGNEMNGYWDDVHPLYGAAAQASSISLLNAAIEASR